MAKQEIVIDDDPGVPRFHCTIPVQASLGKRKVGSLDKDCHPSQLSTTLVMSNDEPVANCWITDDDGRDFGLILSGKALEAFAAQLQKIIEAKGKRRKF